MNTRIPIPPSQWVKERQNNMDLGSASMSVKIVDPVVVKPEQDSKKASATSGIAPDAKNGIAPMTEATIQVTETTRNPSLARMRAGEGFQNFTMQAPKKVQTIMVSINADADIVSPQ